MLVGSQKSAKSPRQQYTFRHLAHSTLWQVFHHNRHSGLFGPGELTSSPLRPDSRRVCAAGPRPTSRREGAFGGLPAELLGEGLRGKVPKTSAAAPSRGRARPCVVFLVDQSREAPYAPPPNHPPNSALSRFFCTFPIAFLGNSFTTTAALGCLKRASFVCRVLST